MSDNLPYAKAPIIEALLDIRVPMEVGREPLQAMADSLKAEYPTVSDTVEKDVPPPTEPGAQFFSPGGLKARREDETRGYRIDPNGLTVSMFRPYSHWADFRANAKHLWANFQSYTGASTISRVGLRFVNLIEVPTEDGGTNLADWFHTSISFPESYGVAAAGFAFRLILPLRSVEGWCSLMCAPVDSKETEILKFFLDIHVYKTLSSPVSSDEAWALFDKLRDEKNHFFEMTITDQTRGLFK